MVIRVHHASIVSSRRGVVAGLRALHIRTRFHAANVSTAVHNKCNKTRLRGTTAVNNERYNGDCQDLNSQPRIRLSFTYMMEKSTSVRVETMIEEI